ncbi:MULTISPECIES: ATP-grasp domain-containing protein [Rhizobium]|uniref:ATP-grasp domain-containing protein n=1 Tax=Rhizobium TaxID=379 RepID=UPI00161E6699|nr:MULTISPECIES: acetyl-CoA carboxylase biotin carboxylase subunit family protein [Rhizobium]MBB6305759.1 biotin carboxylase [Rhizobium leucaenae]MDK4743767.1 acetyl-CoA carboxylase biotin carboxylase subunit family protein [Rhizobium sp. CNPSo 3464]
MTERALILIEGSRGNGPLYMKAAARLGLYPITLSANPTQYSYLAAERGEAIRADTDNLDAMIGQCCRLSAVYDIAGITGFAGRDESEYLIISNLCRHFGLPGPNPVSIEQCYDKFAQRELLAQAGVPVPAYRLATDATGIERSAMEIGLPVILKPVVGSGSSGVRLCRNLAELTEHTDYLLGGKHVWRSSPKILVEEFAQGPYYSVDTMGNEIMAVGTADFGCLPYFIAREYIFPAPLTGRQYDCVAEISLSCLRALGLGWGPANVELRWTKRGPVAIEINPRLPGLATPRLVLLAYGVDLVTEHIKLVIGEKSELHITRSQVAGARFLVPDSDGILDWVDGDERAAAELGVAEVELYVKPKTEIVRTSDYRDAIGHVIATSPHHTQTQTILERAASLITWSIIPFATPAE